MTVQVDAYIRRTTDVTFTGNTSTGSHAPVLSRLNDDHFIVLTASRKLVELTVLVPPIYSTHTWSADTARFEMPRGLEGSTTQLHFSSDGNLLQ